MTDLTVVYYTANREDEKFENNIRNQLIESMKGSDCDLISVSQKPIDLGINICVGEIGWNDFNANAQLKIGIEHAKTRFILSAESDSIYPPSYFRFIPEFSNIRYRFSNVWIMDCFKDDSKIPVFKKKRFSECAQLAGREFWLRKIEEAMKEKTLIFKHRSPHVEWMSEFSCVNIKTENGLRKKTHTIYGGPVADDLPFWGSAVNLKLRLLK